MPIFEPVNGGCAPSDEPKKRLPAGKVRPLVDAFSGWVAPEPGKAKDSREDDSSEWGRKTIGEAEWQNGQQQLETKLHRKAASEMIEHISPGVQGFYSNKSPSFYDRDDEETEFVDLLNKQIAPESFDGGDAWEEDDIDHASAVTIAKELLERGRAKAKGFRTRLVNRVLRKVPFGESIKSVIRGRP